MSKVVLVVAGVANLLFVVFHAWLGYRFSLMPDVSEQVRGLLQTFNAGGLLVLVMLACAFLLRGREVMTTGLGAVVLAYGALLYLSRAGEEYIWLGGNPAIATVCVALGLLHAGLFLQVRVIRQVA
jgi:hypothetical protein